MSVSTENADTTSAVEEETRRIAQDVWHRLAHRRPSLFERRWWDDRLMDWAMADESVKVQMFRFVDVLPMLRTHESVTRHLREYFEEAKRHLPLAARLVVDAGPPDSMLGRAVAVSARSNATRMAKRFIAGETVDEVFHSVKELRDSGFAFTLDLLGEAVISDVEADHYQQQYLKLIEGLSGRVEEWPEDPQLDWDHEGRIPRVNMSVKLSALDSHFDPTDPDGTSGRVKERLREIFRTARQHGAFINIDMEQYAYKTLTQRIFKETLSEPEFADVADVGIVNQAYLVDSEDDLRSLNEWARKRGTPIHVRLVKGAYWDYETVVAKSRGWPIPVFRQKWQSDASFERQSKYLLENYEYLRPAIASHNLRSIAHALAWAKVLDVPQHAYELQMLYGMAGDPADLFAERGYRVRIYTPFGALVPGMGYLVRRLLENTSNDSFLRHSYEPNASIEDLIMNPNDIGATAPPVEDEPYAEFENEPLVDFTQDESREAMLAALEEVRDQFGREYALVINGRAIDTSKRLESANPSNKKEKLGHVSMATPAQATEAIDAARNAFKAWSETPADRRAELLELVAAEMRMRRYELAAWIVFEVGKPWAEADGDVAEAIDFCRYYAQRVRAMDDPRAVNIPGEENSYWYRPRGVAVVISPWNFPLAILTGMTTAALATGNTVVMKPAEQSSIIAFKLMQIFQNAGIPDGVVNYLPGVGEEVGPELVGSPDVDLIAFTGSKDVGLAINATAADTDDRQTSVKQVIAEMGGKNAILIDEDADLDEAVVGVMESAFGYAGQKCSACSRAIVIGDVYDAFIERLVEATKSLHIGPAEESGTQVGPVIDKEALAKIQSYIEFADEINEPTYRADVKSLAKQGHFIGPHIYTEVAPEDRIAQEEIFGPVLAVIRAGDIDEAIEIANNTKFALTAGIFSRSPVNLRKAASRLQAGNIYLNRGITGALVNRQPFGGYHMSGIGSKAGGPDYLLQFVVPVNVTENTMRRGFAPEKDSEA
ncbi:L-glutamate gamma-semialdehyde dehydrogenase [Stratiformator vulcanicus]|uniref:L-glutamate gamma-semialdehyde dehydrogenase n=1 Tax=Stratiformator vulcanicus TaxID=2527980 RepID=A0A517R6P7_9PLAN|nr:L-glutamate gamma-semialdehyde dehydrogenase [Stratiformator vulcanicus]QDT39577.1 1-pyrroline-5-carboxylate dehydrogenase 1 [Stratiformator vulcanicus]